MDPDPGIRITDLDTDSGPVPAPDPDPALFVSDFQDARKNIYVLPHLNTVILHR